MYPDQLFFCLMVWQIVKLSTAIKHSRYPVESQGDAAQFSQQQDDLDAPEKFPKDLPLWATPKRRTAIQSAIPKQTLCTHGRKELL